MFGVKKLKKKIYVASGISIGLSAASGVMAGVALRKSCKTEKETKERLDEQDKHIFGLENNATKLTKALIPIQKTMQANGLLK